ncbi:hypothetical protein [Robertkochia aurantiaca]|uniref:hypothetical protein n=1 Tax=Robertkochia aurantiaca TaxID=2873700 RepID=UPI001CCE28DE|nr:hypothetical protein [Robertkochia sp. 3YJGBD-33]
MKRQLMLAGLGLLIFSCAREGKNEDCKTCEFENQPVSICDNGDGTVRIITEGKSETLDLKGQDFDEVVNRFCAGHGKEGLTAQRNE